MRVHYCWDVEAAAPCCKSQEEAVQKVTVALLNFHTATAFDTVSLSRFTNVAKTRKRLLVGMAHNRLFFSAAAAAASRSSGEPIVPEIATPAEELGARAGDLQVTHRTRCARLLAWFRSTEINFQLAIAETCEAPADRLMYAFFGRDRKLPSVAEILDPAASPIGSSLGTLWALLGSWTASKTGPWKVLPLTGWADFCNEPVRREARAQALGAAAGIVFQYDVRFSSLPWSWFCLVDLACDRANRTSFC